MPARDHIEERVVVLAPTGRDGPLTVEFLERAGIAAAPANDMAALCAMIGGGAAAALVAEEVLLPAATASLARLLAAQEPWSDLPVIVLTGAGGTIQARRPTLETLAPFGNVTLVERPVQIMTLVSAVRAALRARRRQYAARALLARLDESLKSRDHFLAVLGHELRNPLSAISLSSELLEEPGPGSERAVAVIRRQSEKLGRLVDDLLEVSRVTSGKIVLKRARVDLREVVARAVESIETAAADAELRMDVDLAPDPVPVDGDPVRLDQVVGNLLANAVKYTPRGGTVRVRVRAERGRAVVRVRDDGVGISPDMLERIFEPFTQIESSIDRAQGGLGLGLALVRALVSLHGGSIRAESDGVGRGAEFTVELPLLAAAAIPAPRPSATARGAGRCVLVVEDRDDNRDTVVMLLEQLGHRTLAASDGPAAVAAAIDARPDVALVDIGLPGFDGYEVARRIRTALGRSVLLVALTGYGQPEDRDRALAAGFDVHLRKPADAETLERVLCAAGRADH